MTTKDEALRAARDALNAGLDLISEEKGWGTYPRMEGLELYQDAEIFERMALEALTAIEAALTQEAVTAPADDIAAQGDGLDQDIPFGPDHDEAEAELERLRAENERLRAALERIATRDEQMVHGEDHEERAARAEMTEIATTALNEGGKDG